jgi:hypothetical protein
MKIRETTSRPQAGRYRRLRPRPGDDQRSALAMKFLAMIPADVLQLLRTQGPQPKSFGPNDIVVPDPGYPLPRSAERCARFRLPSDHRQITIGPHEVAALFGHRIMDEGRDEGRGEREGEGGSGRLSTRLKLIDWPVIAIGKWGEADEAKARRAEEAVQRNRALGRETAKSRMAWWDGMRPASRQDNLLVEIGNIVQSLSSRHLRRLWKVVEIKPGGELIGRRVSWKTGEVLPGRAQAISVEVVRLVPRTEQP